MKKEFRNAEIEIIFFSTDDVITASAIEGGLDDFTSYKNNRYSNMPLV